MYLYVAGYIMPSIFSPFGAPTPGGDFLFFRLLPADFRRQAFSLLNSCNPKYETEALCIFVGWNIGILGVK